MFSTAVQCQLLFLTCNLLELRGRGDGRKVGADYLVSLQNLPHHHTKKSAPYQDTALNISQKSFIFLCAWCMVSQSPQRKGELPLISPQGISSLSSLCLLAGPMNYGLLVADAVHVDKYHVPVAGLRPLLCCLSVSLPKGGTINQSLTVFAGVSASTVGRVVQPQRQIFSRRRLSAEQKPLGKPRCTAREGRYGLPEHTAHGRALVRIPGASAPAAPLTT